MTWFQSHNGAIAAVVAHAKTLLKLRFQSHNGAIAAVEGLETLFVCGRVSIPQWCDCCFKSVRMTGEMTMFQSHNGAIAALRVREFVSVSTAVSIPQWCDCCDTTPCAVTSVGTSFNPTMVRLLPFILPSPPKFRWCFNPTMVRLLLSRKYCNACRKVSFQSHNGAIAAVGGEGRGGCPYCGFNPTMVRLLHPKMVRLQKQTAAFQSHNGAIAADYLKSSVGQAR